MCYTTPYATRYCAFLPDVPRTTVAGKNRLSDGSRELSAIPSLCGYQSVPTFSRIFKEETGVTMRTFRLQALANARNA